MANQKKYRFLMEIAGKLDSSFSKSLGGAEGKMGKLQSVVAKFGKIAAVAFAAKKVINFGKECVNSAMEFENSMADVAKVVDGLKDKNGKATKSYKNMSDAILNMSKRIPVTADGLAQIVASAGQANIAKKDLLGFAESASKMAIAFDTTAEQSGDWMAQWRTSMKLNQKQVVALSDQINYLGNTSSEKAMKLSEIVSNIGSLGQMSGLAGGQVAALGAATTGIASDVASTGIKNLLISLNAGSSATGKQSKVLSQLGLTATGVAKGMQKDAEGTIMSVLGKIKQLPKAEQAASIKNFFGKESLTTVSVLANNLGNVKDQFEKVGNKVKYAGSMQKEFEVRASTTSNNIELLKNTMNALKVKIGDKLLPIVGFFAKHMAKAIDGIMSGARKAAPIVKPFFGAMGKLMAIVGQKIKPLGKSFQVFGAKIMPILKTMAKVLLFVGKIFTSGFYQIIKGGLTTLFGTVSRVIKAILKSVGGISDFITGVFTGNWKKAWNGVSNAFKGIWNGLVAIAKSPINAIITMINGLIGGINGINIKMPKWLGGKRFSPNVPQIPMLAKGGIVTRPTLALIGESGPEAVTPLSKIDKIKSGSSGTITYAPVISISGNASKNDIEKVMRTSYEEFKMFMEKYKLQQKRKKFA